MRQGQPRRETLRGQREPARRQAGLEDQIEDGGARAAFGRCAADCAKPRCANCGTNFSAADVGPTASETTMGGESGAAAAKAQGACDVSFIGASGMGAAGIGACVLDIAAMPGMAAIMSMAKAGGASIEQGISGETLASAPVFGIQPSGSKPRSRIPASASVTASERMALTGREREQAISIRIRRPGNNPITKLHLS